jgi:ketosteroid isomerase-like protein
MTATPRRPQDTRRNRSLVGLVAAVMASGACFLPGRNPEVPLPRHSSSRDSLMAVDASRTDSLAKRELATAIGLFLDPAVIYLRAGAHVTYGRQRAMALLSTAVPETPTFAAWQPIGGGLSRDRMSGYTFGIAVRTVPGQPGAMIERYVAFWTRARGTPWRISAYAEVSPGSLSATPGDKASPVLDSGRVLRAIVAADSMYAERASLNMAAASLDALAEDGVLLTTTQLVVGPRSAADYFESRRSFSISWVPRDARAATSSDLGFTIGDALVTSLGPTGAAMQQFTKYLTVWRRDPDGRWRVMVTGANDRPSPIGE